MGRRAPEPIVLPPYAPGMRIGVFGGSFNPPHAGHSLVCEIALRRLRLDRIWLLVTPGNPLKTSGGLAPTAVRIAETRALIHDPRVRVLDIETRIGARHTVDTLSYLVRRAPGARFVWIMGADNLTDFHRWRRWRALSALMPVAIVDRPGATLTATAAKTAVALARFRMPEHDAARLPGARPPAWVFLHDQRSALSSTAVRARRALAAPDAAATTGTPTPAPERRATKGAH